MTNDATIKFSGFTPVLDSIANELGQSAAIVYGMIWRFCQMEDGVCFASQDKIADRCGLGRTTVNAVIGKLVEEGYLEDKTPELDGVPHTYAITGKAEFKVIPDENADLFKNRTGGVQNLNSNLFKNRTHKIHIKDTIKSSSGFNKDKIKKNNQISESFSELMKFFCERTKLTEPKGYQRNRQLQWDYPIMELLKLCGFDLEVAKEVVKDTINYMDEKLLTIANFNSIMSIARGKIATTARKESKFKDYSGYETQIDPEEVKKGLKDLKKRHPEWNSGY